MHGGEDAKITFMVDKKENMTFQIDTGTTCNIIPFKTYAKITDDKTGKNLESSTARLVMHNWSREKVRGKVHLRLERKGKAHKLLFLVVDYDTIPLLGKKASEKMGLIKILDSDKVHAVTDTNRLEPTRVEEKTSKAHHIDLQDRSWRAPRGVQRRAAGQCVTSRPCTAQSSCAAQRKHQVGT